MNISIEHARGLLARFLSSEPEARGSGTTTALAAVAIATGGILVAATEAHADDLRRKFPGARVMSLSNNFTGMHGRFLLDHYAVQLMLDAAVREVDRAKLSERVALDRAEDMTRINRKLDNELTIAEAQLRDCRRELAELQARYDLLANQLRAQANEGLRSLAAREAGA